MKKKKNDPARDGLKKIYNENQNESEPEPEQTVYFNPEASDSNPEEPASVLDMQKSEKLDYLSNSQPKKKKSFFKKLTVFLLAGCLLAVGFLIWQTYDNLTNPLTPASKNVILNISGPTEIISGELTKYQIVLENSSNLTIKEAEVVARFPSNFIFREFEPEPKNYNQDSKAKTSLKISQYFWRFSNLLPGSKNEITILGQTFGEIGSQQIITVSCHYQPENFSSEFKVSSILKTEISDTLVSLKIDAPTEIVDNAEIEYQIKINSSKKDLATASPKNLRVFIEYPKGFTLSEVKPKTNKQAEQEFWLLENLKEEQIIAVTGHLTGEAGEYKELLVKVGYYVDEDFQLQAGESFITLIIKPELDLTLKANNLKIKSLAMDWGQAVEYSLTLKNTGEVELRDIILKLNFQGNDIINWLNIDCLQDRDCDFFLSTADNKEAKTLIWTRDQLDDLETLIPGGSKTVILKLNIQEQNPNERQENLYTEVQALADFKIEEVKDSVQTESNKITTKVKTAATLKTEARYYTDEYLKIGSGPLPPLVGAATSFRIFWQVDNTSNALKDVKVTTTLPSNVTWTNKIQTFAGTLKYNAYNHQVTWTISSVSAYSFDTVKANFEISVTPTLTQVGEYLTLTQETTLEATDNFTNESVSDVAGYLTSELENDLRAQGKGRVE